MDAKISDKKGARLISRTVKRGIEVKRIMKNKIEPCIKLKPN